MCESTTQHGHEPFECIECGESNILEDGMIFTGEWVVMEDGEIERRMHGDEIEYDGEFVYVHEHCEASFQERLGPQDMSEVDPELIP